MKSWLTHNLGLKIFSILLAAIIWWLIQVRAVSTGIPLSKSPAPEMKLLP